MDFIYEWIPEQQPLDTRRMELFKLSQELGESMVAYSNRISDLADECKQNEITQQESMAMIFICGCRSTRFRQDLRHQGEGISWQFIRKEGAGWELRGAKWQQQGVGHNKEAKPSLRKKPS